MWVVKLGGSLYADPLLPRWLEMLGQAGGGRVVVVCGGGGFADEARRRQAQWALDDLAAHNMAVLAMVQGAYMLAAMDAALHRADSEGDIHRLLRAGRVAVWAPHELLRDTPDASTNWDVTSDSLALALARRLNAERLLLVKSCAVEPGDGIAELCAAGVLDRAFAAGARGVGFGIDVATRDAIAATREQLLAGHHALRRMR